MCFSRIILWHVKIKIFWHVVRRDLVFSKLVNAEIFNKKLLVDNLQLAMTVSQSKGLILLNIMVILMKYGHVGII